MKSRHGDTASCYDVDLIVQVDADHLLDYARDALVEQVGETGASWFEVEGITDGTEILPCVLKRATLASRPTLMYCTLRLASFENTPLATRDVSFLCGRLNERRPPARLLRLTPSNVICLLMLSYPTVLSRYDSVRHL